MADWFYGNDNAQHGPISELELRSLLTTGEIEPTTIIWREGMTSWTALSDVPEFQGQSLEKPHSVYPDHAVAQVQPATSGLAITSLVCGILGIIMSTMFIGGLLGLPAVICGHLSLKKIRQNSQLLAGKGLAIAGLIMGYISMLISLILITFIIFFFSMVSEIQKKLPDQSTRGSSSPVFEYPMIKTATHPDIFTYNN